MLIDTHSHLNFPAFKADFKEVVKRSLENGVWLINIGSQYTTSKRAIEIAEKYPEGVYAAVGFHPIHLPILSKSSEALEELRSSRSFVGRVPSEAGDETKSQRTETGLVKIKIDPEEIKIKIREESFDYEQYKKLAHSEKVVAIGEIGLDYYWRPKTTKKKELFKEKQKNLLSKQLELAKELNLPVIFHCRMAHQDLIQFLKENEEIRPEKAVVHGFVGNLEELKAYLDFGFYIGFNGIIFKNIEGIDFGENIGNTPLDKILIETDCPYLTPHPFENQRNEPLYLKYVVEKIAKIKNLSFEEITKITTENAKKLFRI